MIERIETSRRSFLRILAWWVSLAGAHALLPAVYADGVRPDVMRSAKALVDAQASATAIGRLFLRTHPEDADEKALLVALGLHSVDPGRLSDEGVASQRKRLLALHQDDFAADRVRQLDGYLFSVTELRLAALIALPASS